MRIVIAAVNYDDFLQVTLPAWVAVAKQNRGHVVIVTTLQATSTTDLALQCGATVLQTDAFYAAPGARFDKAAALSRAFGMGTQRGISDIDPCIPGERCISADADCYPVGILPASFALGVLYGCPRYHAPDPATLDGHLTGAIRREALSLILPKSRRLPNGQEEWPLLQPDSEPGRIDNARRCLGYFQGFAFDRALDFGSYPTAGKYDMEFRKQFHSRGALADLYCLHLGGQEKRNWTGRTLPAWG